MRLWLLYEDWKLSEVRLYPKNTGRVLNGMEIADAVTAFHASLAGDAPWPDPYPSDFPAPRVRFAEQRLPDFNIAQNLTFVSERMRHAMDVPESAAEFLPVRNLSRTLRARAAQYSLLHVRAFADAIDAARSDCQVETYASAKTQGTCERYIGLTGIRLRPGFTPPADLFRDTVEQTILFATDALAERVIGAGCTGVQFRHPLWFAPGCEQVVKTRGGAARVVWDADARDYSLTPFPLSEADLGPPATAKPRVQADQQK